ncbi:sigma factor-like helix-turn-helix DNA-binding protein [Streptomyces sp. NPDC059893]|uniref:sigma factor-like helix-turn-helix DNA-binding protein n=1 Tax=Streptomyces sp. NPDC059893 TaxID=3346990 RepID=UPI00365343B5
MRRWKKGRGPCCASRPERERTTLYMRFFRDMTQARIAEQLGISQIHASSLIIHCFGSATKSSTTLPDPA